MHHALPDSLVRLEGLQHALLVPLGLLHKLHFRSLVYFVIREDSRARPDNLLALSAKMENTHPILKQRAALIVDPENLQRPSKQ